MRRKVAVLAVLLATLLLVGCGLQQDLGDRSDVAGDNPPTAPAISGTTTTGQTVDASTFSGKVAVIDFWASWCGPCRGEQPDLNKLANQYQSKGVVFLGVDMRDDVASANAYRSDFNVPYQSVEDNGEVSASYNVSAPPTLVVINRSGSIVDRALGTVVGVSDVLQQALRR